MKRIIVTLIMLMVLGIMGCQNSVGSSSTEKYKNIAVSLANKEYDSIDDFLVDNDEAIFIMNPQKMSKSATSSNAAMFTAIDNT